MLRERSGHHGRHRVGIVGGGAAGTLVAVNLLRELDFPAEILLFDDSGDFGPGIPYLTRNPEHRLNVPAIRMSALEEEPSHFLEWLRQSRPESGEATYASRGAYGQYLRDLLDLAELNCKPEITLRRVPERVLVAEQSGRGFSLTLDGWRTKVDHLVLATGPIAGNDPVQIPASLKEKGVYIAESWDESAVLPARGDRDVLVIGTGLTMVDVALTLGAGATGPRVRAISRHGQIPRAHRADLTTIRKPAIPVRGPLSIEDLLTAFTGVLSESVLAGGDWRDAIDSMRRVVPDAWRRLPVADRKRFLDEMKRVWEIHRYRMAPEVAARFEELTAAGRVEVTAAAVGSIEDTGSRARVSLVSETGTEVIEFDRIISAAGATTEISRDAAEPIHGMLERGVLGADELGLGLNVDRDGAVRDHRGERQPAVSALGSLRRGVEWETIGVTELRWQAPAIARRIATQFESAGEAAIEPGLTSKIPG